MTAISEAMTVPAAALWNGPLPDLTHAPRTTVIDIFIAVNTLLLSIAFAIRFRRDIRLSSEVNSTMIMGILADHVLRYEATYSVDLEMFYDILLMSFQGIVDGDMTTGMWNNMATGLLNYGMTFAQIIQVRHYIQGFIDDGIDSSISFPDSWTYANPWAPNDDDGVVPDDNASDVSDDGSDNSDGDGSVETHPNMMID
jgi:hypothetical protein